MTTENSPLQILVIVDGKPGHENQSFGLCEALRQYTEINLTQSSPLTYKEIALGMAFKQRPASWKHIPRPDLVIATGSRTHFSLITAGRIFDSFTTLLCSSSLPARLFDLNVIPEHDRTQLFGNVIRTKGVINRVTPSNRTAADKGLILIGGDSKHYQWNTDQILEQLRLVIAANPGIKWCITNSRRTPEELEVALQQLPKNATFYRWQDTAREWLPEELAQSQHIWVTPDSVSMVYEALTSGNAVYLFDLKPTDTRVSESIEKMRGMLTGKLTDAGITPAQSPNPIWEADRIAKYLLECLG